MFLVGDDFYGKVDSVPGLFHVSTRFLHIWWIPVVPRHSYLFPGDRPADSEHRGVRIPLSWKSVFVTWFRGICLMFAVFLTFGPVIAILEGPRPIRWTRLAIMMGVGVVFWAIWRLSQRLTRASFGRALRLGQLLGISASEIENRFGMRTGEAENADFDVPPIPTLPIPQQPPEHIRQPYEPFIVGDGLFGKVDVVRGLFHVRTLFWHFCFVPIIPKGSHLIPGDKASAFDRGIRIPISGRSLFIAWARGGLGVLLLFIALIAGSVLSIAPVDWPSVIGFLSAFLALLTAWILIGRLQKCTYGRALELAALLKIDPDEVELRFGGTPNVDDGPRLEFRTDRSDDRVFRRRGENGANS